MHWQKNHHHILTIVLVILYRWGLMALVLDTVEITLINYV